MKYLLIETTCFFQTFRFFYLFIFSVFRWTRLVFSRNDCHWPKRNFRSITAWGVYEDKEEAVTQQSNFQGNNNYLVVLKSKLRFNFQDRSLRAQFVEPATMCMESSYWRNPTHHRQSTPTTFAEHQHDVSRHHSLGQLAYNCSQPKFERYVAKNLM